MRWLFPVLALVGGLVFHAVVLLGLDLHDLPGPGGVLLARDLIQGQHTQGPASFLAQPSIMLGLGPGLRAANAAALLAAMVGAGLAAAALAGRAAAPWAMLLTAGWAVVGHQAVLVDAGVYAWGLAWLGLGLAWWACVQRWGWLAALGAMLLAVGVAVKASALPVLVLMPLAPWLRPRVEPSGPRGHGPALLCAALLLGLGVGAGLGWAMQGSGQPWLGAPSVDRSLAVGGWLLALVAMGDRGLVQGSFPVLVVLAGLGAVIAVRRQPLALAVLALSLVAMAVIGEARAERLQPRHLLPVSVGLVALVASLSRWRRPRWVAPVALGLLCGVAALDSLAFAHAFSQQRERFAQTRAARLPPVPGVLLNRYGALPWPVFFESSISGVAALVALPATAPRGVASPSYQERRDVHLELAALQAGAPYRRISAERCCLVDQKHAACAAEVVRALDAAGALLVLPGKLEVVAPEDRAFARLLQQAVGGAVRRPARWRVVQGTGSGGELPCRMGK